MTKPRNTPAPIGVRQRGHREDDLPADTIAAAGEREDDVQRLQALLDQLGGGEGYTVRVERVRDPGMRVELAGYLGVLPLTADLYEDVFQSWGGGKYRSRVFQGNDYKGFLTFQVAGESRARDGGAPAAPAAEDSETNKLLRALLTKLDAPPTVSPLAQFAEVAKILKDMQPAAPPASDAATMFEMFNTMLDLRRRVADESGEDRPDNGISTIVREGITPMLALVREHMANEKTTQRQAAAAGGSNGNARRVAQSSPPSDPISQLAARIPAVGRAYLAGAAHAKKDPRLYAELVLDQIPESDYEALPALLAEPDFIPRFLAAVKEFEPFPVWFTELGRCMYTSLTSEILVDVSAAPGDVHASHADDQAPAAAESVA